MDSPPTLDVGDDVIVTGEYRWCGEQLCGEVGTVADVHEYPPDVSPTLYDIARPARVPAPLRADDLALVSHAEDCACTFHSDGPRVLAFLGPRCAATP